MTNPAERPDVDGAVDLDWQVDYHAVAAVSDYLQKQGLLDSAKAVERMLSRAASYVNCRDAYTNLATAEASLSEAQAMIAADGEIVRLADELVNGGGLVNRGAERGLVVVEKADRSDPHYRLCTALEARARLSARTPT